MRALHLNHKKLFKCHLININIFLPGQGKNRGGWYLVETEGDTVHTNIFSFNIITIVLVVQRECIERINRSILYHKSVDFPLRMCWQNCF
jgi:hypothetical protein